MPLHSKRDMSSFARDGMLGSLPINQAFAAEDPQNFAQKVGQQVDKQYKNARNQMS